MATITESIQSALREDGGITEATMGSGGFQLPAAVVAAIDADEFRSGSEQHDIALYATALGIGWALAVLENPFAPATAVRAIATAATDEAVSRYYRGELAAVAC